MKKGKSNGVCSRKGGIKTQGREAVRYKGQRNGKGEAEEKTKSHRPQG